MARKISNGTLVVVPVQVLPENEKEENKANKGRVRGYNKKRKEYVVNLPSAGKVSVHRSKVHQCH